MKQRTPTNDDGQDLTARSPQNGITGAGGAAVPLRVSTGRWQKKIRCRYRRGPPVASMATTHTGTAKTAMRIKCIQRECTQINTIQNQKLKTVIQSDVQKTENGAPGALGNTARVAATRQQ